MSEAGNNGFEYAKFKGYRCFKTEWAGFEEIYPINVIIGRNNSGKSALLDLIDYLTEENKTEYKFELCYKDTIEKFDLSNGVISAQDFQGNSFFIDLGPLIGTKLTWDANHQILDSASLCRNNWKANEIPHVINYAKLIIQNKSHCLKNKTHRRVLAERDVKIEQALSELKLGTAGEGTTNICRKYITSANDKYSRTLIQCALLDALNEILGKDAEFTEIQVQQHDDETDGPQEFWEIYLLEESKGLIPLSKSGSGLKTIFIVLLNLLAVPDFENKEASTYVFSFEELENNLHPALQRRLFDYIHHFAIKHDCHVFLTTHSSVVLDIFAGAKDAQILHVEHDGESACVKKVDAYFDQLNVVNDLGAKASDLLQANGIVWLEGPSDRIYFNKWMELSGEKLKEGVDYQCAFFGGSVLVHYAASPNPNKKINLLKINPNAVLITDGDRTAATGRGAGLKHQVIRIRNEINKLPKGHAWVTKAKEIESYIPPSTLKKIWGKNVPHIGQHESFATSTGKGYFPLHSPVATFNKVAFAQRIVPELTLAEMKKTFEWEEQMAHIIETIRSWNTR